LLEAGFAGRIALAFTAMASNVHEATALMDLALEKDIRAVIYSSLLAGGNARSNWEDLSLSTEQALQLCELTAAKARELTGRLAVFHKGFSLGLGKPGVSKTLCSIGTNLRIDPEGNVYPCQCFVGGEDYRLGNLREQPLEEMVLGSRLQQIKEVRRERIELIEECRECPWRHFCGAGCMGHAYHMEGTILSVPDCEILKRWTERLFELNLTHCLAHTPAEEPEWL
jgi:radical SAM protein with 4Fe4S-binding SPASM domain